MLEEQGKREEAFRGYQEFLKAYPESEWADDARTNLVALGRHLARTGKPEYEAVIKSLGAADDEDVAMAALVRPQGHGRRKRRPDALRPL